MDSSGEAAEASTVNTMQGRKLARNIEAAEKEQEDIRSFLARVHGKRSAALNHDVISNSSGSRFENEMFYDCQDGQAEVGVPPAKSARIAVAPDNEHRIEEEAESTSLDALNFDDPDLDIEPEIEMRLARAASGNTVEKRIAQHDVAKSESGNANEAQK